MLSKLNFVMIWSIQFIKVFKYIIFIVGKSFFVKKKIFSKKIKYTTSFYPIYTITAYNM